MRRFALWWRIFAGPVPKVVGAIYAIVALASWLREEVAPQYLSVDQLTAVRQWAVVPVWPLHVWLIVGLILLVVILLEWTYKESLRSGALAVRGVATVTTDEVVKTNRFLGSSERHTITTTKYELPTGGVPVTSVPPGTREEK